MLSELQKLWEDIDRTNLPKNIKSYNKIKFDKSFDRLSIGKRIFWYYKEDLEFWKQENKSCGETTFEIGYSGIVIPIIDCQHPTHMDIDEVVVIQDRYPAEKENCETSWIALKRLIDDEDLVEIIGHAWVTYPAAKACELSAWKL